MADARPNLFSYATSELSQDAFLAWLLSWADREGRAHDERLAEVGQNFLELLFRKHGLTCPSEACVSVKVQDNRIDVAADIDAESKFRVLIEDKVGTSDPSAKLERYLQQQSSAHSDRQLVPVYVQTHEQPSYRDVEEAEHQGLRYRVVSRLEVLSILRPYRDGGGENAILLDFLEYLEGLDAEFKAFESTPITERWSGNTWRGFLAETKQRLGPESDAKWSYVANPRGGFFALYWHWTPRHSSNQRAYLQLENRGKTARLTFRVHHPDQEGRRRSRKTLYEAIKAVAGDKVVKPRGRSGKTMRVAMWDGDYREKDTNDVLDWPGTIETLREAERILSEAARSYG